MSDVELIDFTIPCGVGHVLYLPMVPGHGGKDAAWLSLHSIYSQFGLIYQVLVVATLNLVTLMIIRSYRIG